MRSGTCTVQQTLTAEAASVLKHSLTLARRRGHAQVTPLHVAATLLTSRTSLLRRACLKSQPSSHQSSHHLHHHHHPLQCRALELCFNVALNRLPTTPGPLIHTQQPSLSNALIAALKRAQAHQRRGCIEQQQQQPLLTIKVELEQLIISILDDPSVSRVMREAGFSSTCVKNNIEDSSSSSSSSIFQCYSSSSAAVASGVGVFSSPCSPNNYNENQNPWNTHFLSYSPEKNPLFFSPQRKVVAPDFKEDVKLVLEVFMSKKRKNTVIVGDSVSVTESVVSEIMGRVERGEVPVELKKVQFVKFQFAPVSLRFMKKEDVEMNVSQLKNKVEAICMNGDGGGGGGVIIYTGDLKWTVEEIGGEYNPVDDLVREIGKIVCDLSSLNGNYKVWLMGSASYQTYMRCQMRQPPLEIQWGLQAVSVPSGGLGLTLHAPSIQVMETKPLIGKEKDEQDKLNCCQECTSSYEKEAQLFKSTHHKNLPLWLHPQKDELVEMRRKWNGLCQGLNHQGKNTHFYNNNGQGLIGRNNAYPWWSTTQSNNNNKFISDSSNSISFTESGLNPVSLVPKFRRQQSCSTIDFNFGNGIIHKQQTGDLPNLDSLKNTTQDKELKITLALGNSILSDIEKREKWRSDLCKLLQENVPWQSDSIDSIVDVLAESKSNQKGTWLMIQGNDTLGKRRLALAIAESVLGSPDSLVHFSLRKRENIKACSDTIIRSLRNEEKIVALIEDVDFADTKLLNYLADAFLTRKFDTMEPVFILTRGSGDSLDHHEHSVIHMKLEVKETDRKRKSEEQQEQEQEQDMDIAKKKKHCFSRQSSFTSTMSTLDLNMMAEENEEKKGENSPISSNLSSEGVTPNGILELLMKNKYVFEGKQDDLGRKIGEEISWKMRKCMEEEYGEENVNRVGFRIEEKVVEEIIKGYGSYTNSKIERWVKEVFKTSLKTVENGGKGKLLNSIMEIRLCFGGGNGNGNGIVLENGYMGTCLPKKIQVSFRD
ncbi:protein SMAX1-LIKE 4 [Euphorbia lathyris]|uniref:protein SMAX1-LIKE 4 n=1 Tax=Euphorbia lathyris TaxID=212925 RepID=UPI0033139D56